MSDAHGDDGITLSRVVEVMARRLNHLVGARCLRSNGVAVGRNWTETLAKVSKVNQDTLLAKDVTQQALELLRVHSLIGNKRVTWYDLKGLNADMVTSFSNWLDKALDSPPLDESWVTQYPFPLTPIDDTSLRNFDRSKPKLVKVWQEGGRTYFQFFSVRTYNERVELAPTSFSKDAYENIRQYSKIIGIKQKFAPCFDTVVVDRSEQRIELRVDVPSAHVPNEIQQIANQHVLGSFNALSYQGCQTSIVGLSAFDFFPMLLPLYRDNTAGKVSTLGFAAYAEDSASNNTGRPIRKKGHDLREDKFHKSGAAAVEDLRPYTIGVEWPALGRKDEVIELEIPGSIHCLYKSRALHVANLSGCVTFAEYEFLTHKIWHYSEIAAKLAAEALSQAQKAIESAKAGA
ncbi:hypothetical protein QRO11_13840 [Paracidovorax citrulli]|nr:hypothetical protein [Paracidovorax citrulli]PVY63258.1 hypothetical protein C8E08_0536 [Paracidovorax citrulli]QCX12450.1 hypothetical protein APS58_3727 [Paracidovorax citrulli]REG67767.1 hypothetical protein C8E07_0851 [Paracidovorax citrulli]RLJ92326.1 hypothetical protein C8E06_0852 [Paracidovorax citrulli]UEG44569.1 hypothetical protein LKW27_12900 [Paracidovorax citrulli]